MIRFISLCCLLGMAALVQAAGADDAPDVIVERNISYVSTLLDQTPDPQRMLDIYRPRDTPRPPVILYLHGGGWAFGDKSDVHIKPGFFARHGFAFVSMNYRLRWDYKVYDQLVDIVQAVRWLREQGAEHGIDGSRLVLMGHAAGGHLASLVVTDKRYFRAEEVPHDSIKAVVSIDSTSYDIPRVMRELGSFVERRQHELIFTPRPDVWTAASPITHISADNRLPAFALLFDPEREVSKLQARGFAKALGDAGVAVVMIPGSAAAPDKTDELIGAAGNVATGALMAFLRSQI